MKIMKLKLNWIDYELYYLIDNLLTFKSLTTTLSGIKQSRPRDKPKPVPTYWPSSTPRDDPRAPT